MKKLKQLTIYSNNHLIGELRKDSVFSLNYINNINNYTSFSSGKLNEYSFSLHFTQNKIYNSSSINSFPFLTSHFPEGFLLEIIKEDLNKNQLLTHYKIDEMFLLALLGEKQIGRLSFKTEDKEFNEFLLERKERNENPLLKKITLTDLLKNNSDELFLHLLSEYLAHFSLSEKMLNKTTTLSGFQPKISLMIENKQNILNNQYIIKTFSSSSFEHLSLNEFICMTIAKEAGLDVPNFYLSDDQKLFVIQRFDFLNEKDKFGVEDFCSLRNFSSEKKYHSNYFTMMKIMKELNPFEVDKLFSHIALSARVKNGDAHLKNFSILYQDINNIKLSPLYDVVNTAIYPTHQDKFGKIHFDNFAMPLRQGKHKNFPSKEELTKFGEHFIENPKEIIEKIDFSIEKVLKDYNYLFSKNFFKTFSSSLGFNFQNQHSQTLVKSKRKI